MKHALFSLTAGLLCCLSVHAATINHAYDGSKSAAENGTALQAAVNAASAGDEIKVQAGSYIGNFSMKEGVNVSGGWNEGFTAQTDYASVLDANENGRVLEQPSNFTTWTIWSNFTIQNGKLTAISATPANGLSSGVALAKKGRVQHCLIQYNTYTYNGNCMGGGVGNDAVDANTDVCVDDCWIRNNKASHGGGVRVRGTVQNSIIENNLTEANSAGGAHLQAGRLVNCIVRGNTGKDAGGVRAYGKCDIINNLIYNNTASNAIGGLSIEGALSNVIGNTIVSNNQLTGTGSQAGVKVTNTLNANNTFFVNNVIWGNMSNGTVETQQVYYISRYDKSAGQRSYNAILGQKGDDSAETSIQLTTDDPGFTDAANGDFSLLSTSVLLDRGNSDKATVAKDLAGNDRIVNAAVDMGAYEYPVLASDVYVLAGEDLQTKINNTAVGYTVYVQAGTFYGNFTMKDGVNVSGGWDATFENQTDYTTILDAQNSGRVVNQPANFSNLTVWSNLTIQHGNLTANMDNFGSGVFLRKNGQVKHCIIQDNTFTYTGANCLGGGVANDAVDANTDVCIDDCIIRRNQATHGGGVRIKGTIQNSIIEENSTTNNAGGGVHLFNGGCMYNCIVRGNISGGDTGGVRMSGNPSGKLANCLIVGNHAAGKIGGLALETTTHTVYNNTIVNNSQASSANPDWCGVRLNVGGPLQFCNNIVWGNKADNEVQESQILVLASYSQQANNFVNNALVWNGKLSDGNDFEVPSTIFLSEDPFNDAANADYTPTLASGLIDTGHGGYFHGTTDLAGNKRKQGTIDRGCFEQRVNGRKAEDGKFGTICLPYAVEEFTNAKVYKVLSFATDAKNGLLLEEVDALVAGKPYFFLAQSDTVSFAYTEHGDAAEADHENGLYGTIAGTNVSGQGYYILQENELRQTYNEATSEPIEVTVGANRAYLYITEVPDAPGSYAPSPRHRIINIHQEESSATALDVIKDAQRGNAKIMKDGNVYILRDGKVYDALGQGVMIK